MQPAKPFITPAVPNHLENCRLSAEINGAIFLGVQSAYGVREDLALFQRRPGASTIALPLSKVSPLGLAYAFCGRKFVEAGR